MTQEVREIRGLLNLIAQMGMGIALVPYSRESLLDFGWDGSRLDWGRAVKGSYVTLELHWHEAAHYLFWASNGLIPPQRECLMPCEESLAYHEEEWASLIGILLQMKFDGEWEGTYKEHGWEDNVSEGIDPLANLSSTFNQCLLDARFQHAIEYLKGLGYDLKEVLDG